MIEQCRCPQRYSPVGTVQIEFFLPGFVVVLGENVWMILWAFLDPLFEVVIMRYFGDLGGLRRGNSCETMSQETVLWTRPEGGSGVRSDMDWW